MRIVVVVFGKECKTSIHSHFFVEALLPPIRLLFNDKKLVEKEEGTTTHPCVCGRPSLFVGPFVDPAQTARRRSSFVAAAAEEVD